MPDLDNDGLQDLFYVTGNVYPEVERAAAAVPASQPAAGVPERGPGAFEHVTPRSGDAAVPHSSRGAAFGDIDNDGDIDVLVMNMNEPPSLLRNDYAGGHGWIELALEGTRSNRSAIGATVVVTAGGRDPGAHGAEPVELLLARRPAAALRAGRAAGPIGSRSAGRPEAPRR